MGMQDKKVGILIENNYEDLEFWYPYYRLQEDGIQPIVIGPRKDTFKSKHGYEVSSDIPVQVATDQTFDAIIIPGGYAPDLMRTHNLMVQLVKKTYEQGHLVAAICHAAWVLASAGIIKGKKVTCYHSIKDDIKNAGANYLDEPVVVDEHLITSRQPEDLPVFCSAILKHLSETN